MIKQSLIFIALALGLITSCHTAKQTTSKTDDAVEFLKKTEILADTNIGACGSLSPEACAFAIVKESSDHLQLFHEIYNEGTIVGKTYALIGLYCDNKEFFHRELEVLREANHTVEIFFGCSRGSYDLSKILLNDDSRTVRLSDDCTTISQWLKKHSPEDGTFCTDIYGGSYSEQFYDVKISEAPNFKHELEKRKNR